MFYINRILKKLVLIASLLLISSCSFIDDAQEELIAENTLVLIADRCGEDIQIDGVSIPRFAFFERKFEATVFLKNINYPDTVISIPVQITSTGNMWFGGKAYYEIPALDALKLIPLGCGFGF
tara:strand:+ start:554 stop:922 length:369 start_codon:yes stop_codon:yes gene_type:complete